MTLSTTHRFLLRLPRMGRDISSDGWQEIEPKAAQFVAELQHRLNSDVIDTGLCEYQFTFDLEPVINNYIEYHRLQTAFEDTKDWSIWSYYNRGDCNCFIQCVRNQKTAKTDYDHTESILEFVIYEIFLAMCISIPGTFNLDGAEFINIPEKRSVQGSIITHAVSASSHLPENYHYELEKQNWIKPADVSVIQALEWMQRVNPRFNMLAENPASRSLLALLYLCKGDSYSGAGAAWLFNGLESLFGSRPGENRATLVTRISILLELNAGDSKKLKKAIGELYDIRSAFVHGGLATVHPVRDESLDNRVDEEILKVMRAMDKGITILIAVIRNIINKDMDWPRFEERLLS